jgi:hypothetical protein
MTRIRQNLSVYATITAVFLALVLGFAANGSGLLLYSHGLDPIPDGPSSIVAHGLDPIPDGPNSIVAHGLDPIPDGDFA